MNLKSYCEGWLHENDCVSISVSDYGWGSSTYKGMIIDTKGQKITVLFTDGNICSYYKEENSLRLLKPCDAFAVTDKIIKVLEHMDEQNTKLEQQKAKIKAHLGELLK